MGGWSPKEAAAALAAAGSADRVMYCPVCGRLWSEPARHYALGSVECPGGCGRWRPLSGQQRAEVLAAASRWVSRHGPAAVLPAGLVEGADGSVVCRHRDVSCCDACRALHPWLIDVAGVVYFIRDAREREELRHAGY